MPDASSTIVSEKVAETRDALLRHSDAVDAKGGVLLGASGAFVALALTSFSWWRVPGVAVALVTALECLRVYLPDRYPTLELRRVRERYLAADPSFTQRHLMDTEIAMIEQHSLVLRSNAHRLRLRRDEPGPRDGAAERGYAREQPRRLTMANDPKDSAPEGPSAPQSTPPEPPAAPPFAPDLDLIGDLERGQRAALNKPRR